MSDYFDRIERQIARRVQAGTPRRSWRHSPHAWLAPAFSVVVVVAVVVTFLGVGGSNSTKSRSGEAGGVELVYRVEPVPGAPAVTSVVLQRTIAMMRLRAAALGISGASVRKSGNHEITVRLLDVSDVRRAEQIVGQTARLYFYDWEANVLTPNGKTVASQLQTHDRAAITLSQGSGSSPAGDLGAGSVSLYDAVKLASKQSAKASPDNARSGPQYYLFGAPGSAACATAAKAANKTSTPGVHCLLGGPDTSQTDLADAVQQLGLSFSSGEMLVIPPGTAVIQAADPSASHTTSFNDPSAQFYVLNDHVSLIGNEITNPRQSTDQAVNPDITFSLTSKGRTAFQKLTSTIAHRGELASSLGQELNQHFAVALNTKLLTVRPIDFKTYPDGVRAPSGDITAGLTIQSARNLATQLRLGTLPADLRLISAEQLSARG